MTEAVAVPRVVVMQVTVTEAVAVAIAVARVVVIQVAVTVARVAAGLW